MYDEIKGGISVVWKNLNVVADVKQSHLLRTSTHTYKEIIRNANGAIKPGNLVAILGASGSGKSTLMSILANRNPGDLIVEGDVRINGRPIGNFMRSISGYVYQDDLFIPSLTVLEHLNITAQIKLDRRISAEFRKELISKILTDLGLQNCADSFIGSSSLGDEKVNLSGGEQKRLAVATELLTDPLLLFCDEPTTGLDSYSALKLMTILREIASGRNKTIVCSIHQPSYAIFSLFHQIILLREGRIAYIGNSENAVEFFKSQGYDYKDEQNPAEYLVKSLAVVPGGETDEGTTKVLCDNFEKSVYGGEIRACIDEEMSKTKKQYLELKTIQKPSWFYVLAVITYRSLLCNMRDVSVQGMRIFNKLATALITGICLMGLVDSSQNGVQALQGAVFTLVSENFFPPLYGIIDHIPEKMPVFIREYANSLNTPLIFLLSNIISLIPINLLDPVMYTLVMYSLVHLKPTLSAYLLTILVNILVLNTSTAFGLMLSALTNSSTLAGIVAIPIDNFFMAMSGILISLRSVPAIFAWVRYISWFTYGCEAIYIIQMEGVQNITCPIDPSLPCLSNGEEVLKHYDYHSGNFVFDISMIFTTYIVLIVASYVCLVMRLNFQFKK